MSLTLGFQGVLNASQVTGEMSPGGSTTLMLRTRVQADPTQMPGAVYVQLFEGAAPATGSVPSINVPLSAQGYADIDFGITGRQSAGNTYIVLSSTPLSYTRANAVGGGALEALFDIQYTLGS